MDKFPLLLEGRPSGELTAEREPLYTCLSARLWRQEDASGPPALWCAWAVGERGELRLGVLEPEGACLAIRRRFSDRLTAPLGRILRGEVRPVRRERAEGGRQTGEDRLSPRPAEVDWRPVPAPERLFRTPWLRQRLRGLQGLLLGNGGGVRLLAVPWDPRQPFPLAPLFCFAALRTVGGRPYAVFAFDREERPVFWEL